MRPFLALVGLALVAGCTRSPAPPPEPKPNVRLAVITDLKGYLEPCGCTSNPLGGIDRLAAQIGELRQDGVPLTVFVAGDVFFDTETLEPARVDQAQRNATTLAGILNRIGVTAIVTGSADRAQSREVLDALRGASEFPWLADTAATEVVRKDIGGVKLAVFGARSDTDLEALRTAGIDATTESDVSVLLVDGSRRDANKLAGSSGVDFVIAGGLDQDEPVAPKESRASWVLHASRQGQGLTVVDVYLGDGDGFENRSQWSRTEALEQLDRRVEELASKVRRWEASQEYTADEIAPQREQLTALKEKRAALAAPLPASTAPRFDARFVELQQTLPKDKTVSKLMREHDKAVNEANRIAFADLKPPPLGPDDVAYVGSPACASCHASAFAWWRNHAHGAAYLTLQQRHKEFNLDCVGCHVTGYEQPGGSTVTHNLDLALVGVGCESCHGPGAEHVENPEVKLVRDTPESTCVVCHNEEHSDLFDYEEYLQNLVVPGHGLPVRTRGVTRKPEEGADSSQ
jgi:hypothetical protein